MVLWLTAVSEHCNEVSPSPGRALLETRALTVAVAGCTVCRELNIALYPGQCWGMLGVNGVGKTTLLHTLAGLRPALAGEVALNGMTCARLGRREWARRLGIVFQDERDPFPATVGEVILTGRHPHRGWFGWESAHDYALAEKFLTAVGLAGYASREITTLSGGEQQRLRHATFLVQETALGLLDEPTNHLDPAAQVGLLSLLREQMLIRSGALFMALHDVNWVARFCDHCLLLFGDGNTQAGLTSEILNAAALQRLYRHPLAEVITPWGRGWLPA